MLLMTCDVVNEISCCWCHLFLYDIIYDVLIVSDIVRRICDTNGILC